MTENETLENTVDLSDEVLTVGQLMRQLERFDPHALIMVDDPTSGVHLEIYKITQATQPGCDEKVIRTVYLEVEE